MKNQDRALSQTKNGNHLSNPRCWRRTVAIWVCHSATTVAIQTDGVTIASEVSIAIIGVVIEMEFGHLVLVPDVDFLVESITAVLVVDIDSDAGERRVGEHNARCEGGGKLHGGTGVSWCCV